VCVCVCVKNVYLFYKFPIYVEQCSLYIRYIAIVKIKDVGRKKGRQVNYQRNGEVVER